MNIPKGVDFISFIIPRYQIEARNIDFARSFFISICDDSDKLLSFQGRISLGFEGYDDDPRELFEIEEVRTYIKHLTTVFPYWLYFINRVDSNLKILLLSLCRYTKKAPGLAKIHSQDSASMLSFLFKSLNKFCKDLKIPENVNKQITEEVVSYFQK